MTWCSSLRWSHRWTWLLRTTDPSLLAGNWFPAEPDFARCILQHIRNRAPQVELSKLSAVGHAQQNQVGLGFYRLFDNGCANIARLQNLRFDGLIGLVGHLLDLVQDAVGESALLRDIGVQRQRAPHLDHIDSIDLRL